MAERPLGLISVDELVRVLPDLIADALRERDTRPPPASQATLTKATGVVTTAGTTTAEVQLDEDEPGVLSQVQLASAVRAGDRIVVLLSPGGSAIGIGSGSAQATAVTADAALPTDWVYWFQGTNQGPYAWNTSEQPVAWDDSTPNVSHGSAIFRNGFYAEVTEDGWYALDGYIGAQSLSATTGYTGMRRALVVDPSSFAIGSDVINTDFSIEIFDVQTQAAVNQTARSSFQWTGYLMAGDKVQVLVQMLASSDPGDDWEINSGEFHMIKLPM